MAKSWAEVEADQAYQTLPDAEKLAAKTQYFDSVVSSKPEFQSLPDTDKGLAKTQFLGNVGASLVEKKPDLKSMFPKVGVEAGGTSPSDIAISTLQGTGKDILAIPAHFFNQLGMNYPRALLQKAGIKYPEDTTSPAAGVAAKTAGVVGAIENPLFKMLGIGPASSIPAKIAATGAAGALYAPTDEPGFTKKGLTDRAINAGAGAATAGLLEGAGAAASKAVKNTPFIAARIVNSLIKPLGRDFSYGKNPGLGIISEGITGNNLDELASNVSTKRSEIGNKIGTALGDKKYAAIRFDLTDAITPIDEAMQKAAAQNNESLLNRLAATKKALTEDLHLGTDAKGNPIVQSNGVKNLVDLTPPEAAKIKTDIGDTTKWTGNPSDDKAVNGALKKAYGIIKEKIGTAIPEVKGLNERYANLTGAMNAIQHREGILARQNLVGLAPKVISGGAIMHGLTAHDPLTFVLGMGTLGIDKALSSPAVKTRLAVAISKMSSLEKNAVFSRYPQLASAIEKASVGKFKK